MAYYYKFILTKEEEEEAENNAANGSFQVSPAAICCNICKQPQTSSPWKIRKKAVANDVDIGFITLSRIETLEHILPYWNPEVATNLVNGQRVLVPVWDMTTEIFPFKYGDHTFFEKGPSEEYYMLGWLDFSQRMTIKAGDEIAVRWDIEYQSFHLKLIQKKILGMNVTAIE